MIVFPAIDLKGGQVVRLAEGDMDRATVYGDNPAAQAMLFADAGAEHLHVVDLDGSFAGRAENRTAVEAILETFPGYVQLGGGIRTREAVDGWFDLGVARIVMGTAALKDPQFVKDMAREYEGGIVVAVDARDGMVATEGWAEVSDVPMPPSPRKCRYGTGAGRQPPARRTPLQGLPDLRTDRQCRKWLANQRPLEFGSLAVYQVHRPRPGGK